MDSSSIETLIRPASQLTGDAVERVGHDRRVVVGAALPPARHALVDHFGAVVKVLRRPVKCSSHRRALSGGQRRHGETIEHLFGILREAAA
jgi:hypothetical protein